VWNVASTWKATQPIKKKEKEKEKPEKRKKHGAALARVFGHP
jgi:hypothetical protein